MRDTFEKFGFIATIDQLAEKHRLFLVVQRVAETDLNPKQVTNHDMGQAFEELLRKFNDVSPAGEQYTPRDVIELMVTLLFSGDDDVLSVPGVVRTMYDPTAGTGGILSVAEEYLRRFNSRATLKLFGTRSLFAEFSAPQSFRYLTVPEMKKLEKRVGSAEVTA